MMAAPALAGVAVITQFRKPLVEGGDRGIALLQKILDECLLAIVECLLFREQFFDVVALLLFRHGLDHSTARVSAA